MRPLLLALGLTLVFATAAASGAISTGRSTVRNGSLTLFTGGTSSFDSSGVARIVTVGGGKHATIWHCPGKVWCGEAVSSAWAPDGHRVAVTLDEIGGTSPYPLALHILNVVSGHDTKILRDRVGCFPAAELAWSPNGARLAYTCSHHIEVLTLRGSDSTTVPTGNNAFWPSWSPNAARIAYSTQLKPTRESEIYTVALDGSHRRLVASGGAAPAWSPDGRTIAYQTTCGGIRLVTPSGRNVTLSARANRCGAIGHSGPPVWSPDGTKIAVETKAGWMAGVYVMKKNGRALHPVTNQATTTWYGRLPGRPSWRPIH